MVFFGKNKYDSPLGVIFDVGSGSVGASIIRYGKERPEIIYSKRLPMKITKETNSQKLQFEMLKALENILDNLSKEGLKHLNFTKYGHKKIKYAHIFLSSPWFISKTKILNLKKDKPFEVTREIVEKQVAEEEDRFEKSKEANKAFGEEGHVIERKIVNIKLNGYRVNNPYGKKVKNLGLSLFMSQSDLDVIEAVEGKLLKYLHFEEIQFNSFALSSFSTIRDIYGDIKDFIIIDVTSEVTDLVVCRDRMIYESVSFPYGKNYLLRKITDAFNTVPEDAKSVLKLYFQDEGRLKEIEKMQNVLNDSRVEWGNQMKKTLDELTISFSVPTQVFVTADSDLSEWFRGVIKSEVFSEKVTQKDELSIRAVESSVLNPFMSKGKDVYSDSFLSIDSLFSNKIHNLD